MGVGHRHFQSDMARPGTASFSAGHSINSNLSAPTFY